MSASTLVCANNNQKYGRPNEKTPSNWTSEYTDYNSSAQPGDLQVISETTSKEDVLNAPPVAPNGETADSMDLDQRPDPESLANGDGEKKDKKRKKHEGETAEEKAERKKRKKEKKEKKERKKSKSKQDTSDEESD